MIAEKIERYLSFYKLKLAAGLSAEQAMEKVKYKFSPSDYLVPMLNKRIAGEAKETERA